MKRGKKERLAKAGWRVGSTKDFLGLSKAEAALIEVRVSLARELRRRRSEQNVSQATLAKLVGSSQSRVARMEAGDPSVSLDLLLRTLFSSGTTTAQVGRVIAKAGSHT
jgi:predicted transcriptional regulator